jgi:hypothetical protein
MQGIYKCPLGGYDPASKTARWLYCQTIGSGIAPDQCCDPVLHCLCFTPPDSPPCPSQDFAVTVVVTVQGGCSTCSMQVSFSYYALCNPTNAWACGSSDSKCGCWKGCPDLTPCNAGYDVTYLSTCPIDTSGSSWTLKIDPDYDKDRWGNCDGACTGFSPPDTITVYRSASATHSSSSDCAGDTTNYYVWKACGTTGEYKRTTGNRGVDIDEVWTHTDDGKCWTLQGKLTDRPADLQPLNLGTKRTACTDTACLTCQCCESQVNYIDIHVKSNGFGTGCPGLMELTCDCRHCFWGGTKRVYAATDSSICQSMDQSFALSGALACTIGLIIMRWW